MIEKPLEKKYSEVVNILIFIFPIVIITLQVVGDIILFILAMMGIFVAISKKISPFFIKEIKVFSYLTFAYFIAVCLSVLFSGKSSELAHFIPRDLHFLFAPFIALAIFKAKINTKYLLSGVKVSLLVIGMVIIYFGEGRNHATGIMNPNVFGNLSVALFFIVLVFFQHESFKHKVFTCLTLLFGLMAIVGSGSRGAWLSFLLLLVAYLYFLYKQKIKFSVRSRIIAVIFIASLVAVGSFNEPFKERLSSGYKHTFSWFSESESVNSVSERLEMYSAGLTNIKDVPFFGYGYRTSNIVLFQNVSSVSGKMALRYNHLHNAYLTNYYNGGIVLLGALLLLLFAPLRIFIKANIQNRENPVFISGVLLSLGYASYGMFNILLGDTYMNGFYVFFLAVFLFLANKSIKA